MFSLQCVFCNSDGPFTIEHIIPESLGNDDLLLKEQVCGKCNDYFSRKVEAVVLSKSPIAFWRVFLEIRTKKKLLPSVELSQPQQESGILPSVHRSHDDGISFTAHEDGPIRLTVADQGMYEEIMRGERNTLQFVFTPKLLMAMGRFLCKIGIELVCLNDAVRARSSELERAVLMISDEFVLTKKDSLKMLIATRMRCSKLVFLICSFASAWVLTIGLYV